MYKRKLPIWNYISDQMIGVFRRFHDKTSKATTERLSFGQDGHLKRSLTEKWRRLQALNGVPCDNRLKERMTNDDHWRTHHYFQHQSGG
jgi:hypothetical protein